MDLVQIIAAYNHWTDKLLDSLATSNSITMGLWMTGYASLAIMVAYGFARWYETKSSSRTAFFEILIFGSMSLMVLPLGLLLVLKALPFILVGAFFMITGFAIIKLIPMSKKDTQ